jgi:ankyrin repeat protein
MGDAAALAALPIENLLAADHIGNTAAHLAAKFGHEGCLRVIAQLGVSDDALAAAAGTPELHMLQMRREWGLRALSGPNSNGLTPAHRAALNNHAGCLRLLAELKVYLSPGNLHGAHLSRGKHGRSEQLARTVRTPLWMAAGCGHEPCVRVLGDTALLGQSARDGLLSVDRSGALPMHAAAQNGHVACVQALFEVLSLRSKEQIEFEFMVEDPRRVLMEPRQMDDIRTAQSCSTPLHLAAAHGRADCLRAIVQLLGRDGAAADLSEVDDAGATPAHWAARNGHASCLTAIAECGGGGTLFAADTLSEASYWDTDCSDKPEELERGTLRDARLRIIRLSSPRRLGGRTPAHWAALGGRAGCLEALAGAREHAVRAGVRPHCRFRNRVTYYVSESGMKPVRGSTTR